MKSEPDLCIESVSWGDDTLRVTCSGTFGVGSAGHASAESLARSIRQWMADHPRHRIAQIDVDLAAVDYTFGDGPVAALLPFAKQSVRRFRLLAGPANRDALVSLIEDTKVPWFSVDVRDA